MANALRSALREDPDVILVGEMRDLETIGLALTAAETGHLVMGTLHTSSAAQTIDRIVDVFPEGQQQQIRLQLSNSLVAVFSQTLLQKLSEDGVTKKGRVMAQEIMLVTGAIANLIREQKNSPDLFIPANGNFARYADTGYGVKGPCTCKKSRSAGCPCKINPPRRIKKNARYAG